MSRRNLLILLVAVVSSYACALRVERPHARWAAAGLATIHDSGLDVVSERELFDGAMNGMVEVLRQRGDPHSQFVPEPEAGLLRSEIHQQIGGIGVRVLLLGTPPQLTIAGPIVPDSPAAKANLQPGDRILEVDGKSTAGMNLRDAVPLITGDPGTSVRLTIQRDHQKSPQTIDLVRGVIPVESVRGDRRDTDGRWLFTLADAPQIAHVRITSFGDRTAGEFAAILPKLLEQGVQAIVLDLRDNPGGSLDSAVAVCGMMLPAGTTIVETRGRNGVLHERYATRSDGQYLELPIVVMVNQYSASAAEIVAACLQDNKRAAVAGQRSFGKGTVQQLWPMGNGLLKLTWASFWRPSGANIHRFTNAPADAVWGVSPDPGLAHELGPKEYDQYAAYRRRRDGDVSDASEKSADNNSSDSSSDLSTPAKFVDEQLRLAVAYLQSHQLEKKPAAAGAL